MIKVFTSEQNPSQIVEIKATNANVDLERISPGMFWLIISAEGSTEYLCISTIDSDVALINRSADFYSKNKKRKSKKKCIPSHTQVRP